MFNYNHLFYFYETARLKSVTAAARSIGIQQPSLTIQLKRVENEVGGKLLRKEGRGIVLTSFGESVFHLCRRIFEPSRELRMLSVTPRMGKLASLRLGVGEDVERPYVVDLLSQVGRRLRSESQPYLELRSESHERLMQLLHEGSLDAVISTRADYTRGTQFWGQMDMEVAWIVPSSVKPSNSLVLENAVWALPSEGCRLRDEIGNFFESKKITPVIGFESNVMASVIRAVSDGLGSSLVPLAYVEKELARGRVRVNKGWNGLWTHSLWLMGLGQKQENSAVATLKSVFLDRAKIKRRPHGRA